MSVANLEIVKPTFEDMQYIHDLWLDKKTMEDAGGVIELKEEQWMSWYRRIVEPGDGTHLYYLIKVDGEFVGEVSSHDFDDEQKYANLNIKVAYEHRGNGYSKAALDLFLKEYFSKFEDAVSLIDPMRPQNRKGIHFLEKNGFKVIDKRELMVTLRLTRDDYMAR
jgi:RimJ/RimL family protein N-acetyltransferase